MSVLGESINNKKDVQVWNNAVFDNGCNLEINQIKSPSLDSFDSRKENQSPIGLSDSTVLGNNQSKPFKNLDSKSLLKPGVLDKTDEEIEIENEIRRLFAKLEAIRRKKAEENAKKKDSGVKKIQKTRGFSLGPNEIMSAKTKQLGVTPVQSAAQSRRKSCFWKLEDIEEEKFGFSRGKNLSTRQAVTTGGAKKTMKKDVLLREMVQPKKLFGEQSVPAKKPLKPGRVIASRYNQATESSLVNKRLKKKWEIPSEVKRLDLDENEVCVGPVDKVVLPKIRAVRCVDDSGRDSGPAKRVAELVGKKKSYFHDDDQEVEETVCQTLSFE